MAYDGTCIKDLNVTKPTEGASLPSEYNDAIREGKTVLKNQFHIIAKSANYTLTAQNCIILATGTFTLTLPSPSTVAGSSYTKQYVVINKGSGTVTMGGTIGGISNPTLGAGEVFVIYCNGTVFDGFINKSDADTLDGAHATATPTADKIPIANSDGVLHPNWGAVPVGGIIPYGADSAPNGYFECNGGAKSRTTYSRLFAVIGTTWGNGDGETTFNIPDLRGEFVRGWDHGRGIDSGRSFASYQADDYKSHTHPPSTGAFMQWVEPSGNCNVSGGNQMYNYAATGASGGSETRPRNKAIMYIIKH